ncbi:hypothetical protein [Paenibacillus sp. AGC30]
MRLKRDSLTPDETLSAGVSTLNLILEKTCFDYKVGDRFFFKNSPDTVFTVLAEYADDFVYEGGQTAKYEEIFPIFSVGMLMEFLTELHPFVLNSFGAGWILLWNSEIVIESKKHELSVVFLWRALTEIVLSGKYVW